MPSARRSWALGLSCSLVAFACDDRGTEAPADEQAKAMAAAVTQSREDRACTHVTPRVDSTAKAPGSRQYDVTVEACGKRGLYAVTCTVAGCHAQRMGRWMRIEAETGGGKKPELPPPESTEATEPPDP